MLSIVALRLLIQTMWASCQMPEFKASSEVVPECLADFDSADIRTSKIPLHDAKGTQGM